MANAQPSVKLPLRTNSSQNSAQDNDNNEDIEEIAHAPASTNIQRFSTPDLYSKPPPLQDEVQTKSSEIHNETRQKCLPFLTVNETGGALEDDLNSFGIPHLRRDQHIDFLEDALEDYPAGFVAMDASRPWLFYWSLAGLSCLGQDVSQYGPRLVKTVAPFQNKSGGFGGGHGQMSHIAATYAIVLSLAIVGGEEALNLIDREAMWYWLGSVKQKDGGFRIARGAEEDMRGAYCALTIISLLNLPLELPTDSPARVNGDETFLTGLTEWIARCQTFEGGIGASPDDEAHGAYAFCALACLCIVGEPHDMISRHWVGGCWALLEAAIAGPEKASSTPLPTASLWDREGLMRYVLCCCQVGGGGLRDKPGARPDAYHSCYALIGLNAAQNHYYYDHDAANLSRPLSAGFNWRVDFSSNEGVVVDEEDRIRLVHPIFAVPWGTAERTRAFFEQKSGF
ncbi:MAG: CAAX farnesyltransferase (FTase) subunit beta [Bogoriella megaspora]|nr:MAG: CAAX farnesyltransferase (FTase) subunit beta [Bogoriella megaspora]